MFFCKGVCKCCVDLKLLCSIHISTDLRGKLLRYFVKSNNLIQKQILLTQLLQTFRKLPTIRETIKHKFIKHILQAHIWCVSQEYMYLEQSCRKGTFLWPMWNYKNTIMHQTSKGTEQANFGVTCSRILINIRCHWKTLNGINKYILIFKITNSNIC